MQYVAGFGGDEKKSGPLLIRTGQGIEVGMTGLEPAASTSRTWRANQLRYIPDGAAKVKIFRISGAITPTIGAG